MIETANLRIIPFDKTNITPEYIGWLNNSELMKYSEQRHSGHDYNSCLSYLNSFNSTNNIFAAIWLKDSNIHIGNINAYVDVFNQNADLGILIGNSKVQGKGLGLEAWIAVVCYLFEKRNIRRITAGTMAYNLGMIKIMERSFMKVDSISKRQFLLDGNEIDLVRYVLFKDEFKKMQHQNLIPAPKFN